jgi:hypothetical protein
MRCFEGCKHCDINLRPIALSFVIHQAKRPTDMMVAVVYHQVVACATEFFVGLIDGSIPLLIGDSSVVQSQVLQRIAKSKFLAMDGSTSNEVIDGAIGFADTCMSNAREATCQAW